MNNPSPSIPSSSNRKRVSKIDTIEILERHFKRLKVNSDQDGPGEIFTKLELGFSTSSLDRITVGSYKVKIINHKSFSRVVVTHRRDGRLHIDSLIEFGTVLVTTLEEESGLAKCFEFSGGKKIIITIPDEIHQSEVKIVGPVFKQLFINGPPIPAMFRVSQDIVTPST